MATRKELYLEARAMGKTNTQIANEFGVLTATIDRAIGKTPTKLYTKGLNEMDFDDTTPVETPAEPEKKVLKTLVVNCCDCGTTFSIPPAEQKFYMKKGFELPKRCNKCRQKRMQIEEYDCVDCGATFEIKLTEREFYEKNGLHVPCRCPECRKIKRARSKQQEADKA